jgi:predicted nucleic-acid-binding protein
MIAVDTNVIVGLLTEDDPQQTAYAASLFAANQIWIAKTVILETNWVLKSVQRFRPETVREALER